VHTLLPWPQVASAVHARKKNGSGQSNAVLDALAVVLEATGLCDELCSPVPSTSPVRQRCMALVMCCHCDTGRM